MAPPTKATSNPKKKKPTKHVSIKEQARVKYKKTLKEFKARVDDPGLNTIGTPSGVQRVKGTKKGKRFVNEDTDALLALVAEVNDKQDGAVRSKLQRAREMEQIREQRQRENEARTESKKARVEAKGKELQRKRGLQKDENED